MAQHALLSGYRVLDLAGEPEALCGRTFADLGADVIRVELPGVTGARVEGPFWRDEPRAERSLWRFAYDAGKRGITLDIETADGRALLRHLAGDADFLIESFRPGFLEGLGLGYAELGRRNPPLIMVSITPFGQQGPYAGYEGSDLVALATGGLMYTQGDEDRPPVGFSMPQACLHAAAEAAVGALIAHHYRQRTGQGQHVDVSAQEAVTWTLMNAAQWWDMMRTSPVRSGAVKRRPDGVRFRGHWPCRDGHVTFYGAAEWAGLSRWMRHEGIEDELLARDWANVAPNSLPQAEVDALERLALPFFQVRTAQELYDGAVKWRFILYPVFTTTHLLKYSQLRARSFFVDVEHDELGERVTYSGSFVRATRAEPRLCRRAPLPGEHNREVYQGEMGLSGDDLRVLKATGAI